MTGYDDIIDNSEFSVHIKVYEQYYKREVDWKKAGEEKHERVSGYIVGYICGSEQTEELLLYPQYTILLSLKTFPWTPRKQF